MSSFLLLLWAPVQTVGWAEPSSLANTHLSSLGTVGPQCWKAWAEPSHQFLLFFLEIRFLYLITGLPWWLSGKESPCQWRRLRKHGYEGDSRNMSLIPWIRKIPWRRKWQPTPVFLLGESYGQRNLVGYSPWGHKESDMTEQLHLYHLQGRLALASQQRWSGCVSAPSPPWLLTQLTFVLWLEDSCRAEIQQEKKYLDPSISSKCPQRSFWYI